MVEIIRIDPERDENPSMLLLISQLERDTLVQISMKDGEKLIYSFSSPVTDENSRITSIIVKTPNSRSTITLFVHEIQEIEKLYH